MLNKNDVCELEIVSYGSGGEGIGRIEELVVFVPYAVKGDKLRVRIVKAAKTHCFGRIEEIIEPSPSRTNPVCGVFGKCGGCRLMHMEYEEQLRFKRQIVQDCISRIGKLDVEVKELIPAQDLYEYRNKVQVPIGVDKEGDVVSGFYRMGSHDIISNDCCCIQPKEVQGVIDAVRAWMKQYKIKAYDEIKHKGVVRHVCVRKAMSSGALMVIVVTNGKKFEHREELIEAVLRSNEKVESIVQNINDKNTNVVLGDKNFVMHGTGKLVDEVEGIQFFISPNSFYQVNTEQMKKLYHTAIEMAGIEKTDTVFDLYCGIGTISMFAAPYAKKVIGIEIVNAAVKNARETAAVNEIPNCKFHLGDAGAVTKELYEQGEHADVVFVDPPRKGCSDEMIALLCEMEPKKIVYISCDPATLARDLKKLAENGYQTKEIQPVDMFVHSNHVETVVVLER